MVAKNFEVGDLVWAKMKSYPDWPARIADPPANSKSKKAAHYVYFFGTKNYSWITDDKISHYSEEDLHRDIKKKYFGYAEALEEIKIEFQKSAKKTKVVKPVVKAENEVKQKPAKKPSKVKESHTSPKESPVNKQYEMPIKKESPVRKTSYPPPKKRISVSEESTPKSSKKRRTIIEELDESPVQVKDENHPLMTSFLPSLGHSYSGSSSITILDPNNQKEDSDISEQVDTVNEEKTAKAVIEKKKNIEKKKIGFIGLGMMGRGMVRNLISYKHPLLIWNKSAERFVEFEDDDVEMAANAAEVVEKSDITFCCVSDSHAVRTIMFGENGVLTGLKRCERGSRGYVEMSSIDSETSKELADAVINIGMKYLEAPIIGSRMCAEEGTLLILGAGDRDLFNECEECFHAMSKHAYYISCDVGRSANINIITSTFLGSVHAALAEALSLTERIKLERSDLLEILELRGIISKSVMSKGRQMIKKTKDPDTFLKHQQKDMNLFLRLSETNNHPSPVAAAAHEMYVRCMGIGFSNSDSSSIYNGYKS